MKGNFVLQALHFTDEKQNKRADEASRDHMVLVKPRKPGFLPFGIFFVLLLVLVIPVLTPMGKRRKAMEGKDLQLYCPGNIKI